jgi:nucleotide-binding universal stress UspA family protein
MNGLVLAATDFSPLAIAAARRAAELAQAAEARLGLLHVVSPVSRLVAPLLGIVGAGNPPGPGEALSRLRKMSARLRAEFKLKIEPHLASGSPPAAIAAHAQAADAELIVLGNRGGSFLVDLLRINTAHRVRQRVTTPVLAVCAPAGAPYYNVLLASDLSSEAAHAGRVARRLFPHAELHVLHVCPPVCEGALEQAERQFERFASDAALGYAPVLEVRLGDPAAQIRAYAREVDADVVVLRPARSWLAPGMASSVTEQVLADPPCDALLVG